MYSYMTEAKLGLEHYTPDRLRTGSIPCKNFLSIFSRRRLVSTRIEVSQRKCDPMSPKLVCGASTTWDEILTHLSPNSRRNTWKNTLRVQFISSALLTDYTWSSVRLHFIEKTCVIYVCHPSQRYVTDFVRGCSLCVRSVLLVRVSSPCGDPSRSCVKNEWFAINLLSPSARIRTRTSQVRGRISVELFALFPQTLPCSAVVHN